MHRRYLSEVICTSASGRFAQVEVSERPKSHNANLLVVHCMRVLDLGIVSGRPICAILNLRQVSADTMCAACWKSPRTSRIVVIVSGAGIVGGKPIRAFVVFVVFA